MSYELAFPCRNSNLWLIGQDSRGNMGLGMMAGTSPSITVLPGVGWQVAFQANTGNLWIIGKNTPGDTGLRMMAGTSPCITALPGGGYEVAFQASNGNLSLVGKDNRGNTGWGMMAGTSPSIIALPGVGWQVAFQANTGNLWVVGKKAPDDTGLRMMAGTSPCITALPDGGYEVAFQANNGNLSLVGKDNRGNTGWGMMAGTSPSITALPGVGWQVAFQANTSNLWVVGKKAPDDTGLGMMAGTSPCITALPDGGYQVAFQANTGNLWVVGKYPTVDTQLEMMAGTNPCIVGIEPAGPPPAHKYVLTPPTDLTPLDAAVVTAPASFGWVPGQNNAAIYLNVATNPAFSPIDVVNWVDDGSHCFTASMDQFAELQGATLYWRLVADDTCGHRVMTPPRSLVVGEPSQDPYYVLVHMQWPGGVWDPNDLSSLRTADLEQLKTRVGTVGATPDRKLGISFHVPYLFLNDLAHYKALLAKLFEVCEHANMPVLVGLDGYEWWGGRPDLWNWWDPSKPGYNHNNRANVEWTSWSSNDAVREGWRNWGSPLKLGEPHPNLTSPAFLDASRRALRELATVIADWYASLSASKKYLFAGVKVGWEVSIGVNYFYPLDPTACQSGGACNPSHAIQVGYAAVATAGIKTSGVLTADDLTKAVNIYMREISRAVYEAGVPRRKIFTHVGAGAPGAPADGMVWNGADAALSPYAHPGWSFYTFSAGPAGLTGLEGSLSQVAATHWAVGEWGGPGSNDVMAWANQFEDYFQHGNNKFIASFVGTDPSGQGVATALDRHDFWMHPPILRAEVDGHRAKLSWSIPGRATALYLNVTTDPTPAISGGFATVNIANEKVTGAYTRELPPLAPGKYYAKLFADAHGRRVISDIVMFQINQV